MATADTQVQTRPAELEFWDEMGHTDGPSASNHEHNGQGLTMAKRNQQARRRSHQSRKQHPHSHQQLPQPHDDRVQHQGCWQQQQQQMQNARQFPKRSDSLRAQLSGDHLAPAGTDEIRAQPSTFRPARLTEEEMAARISAMRLRANDAEAAYARRQADAVNHRRREGEIAGQPVGGKLAWEDSNAQTSQPTESRASTSIRSVRNEASSLATTTTTSPARASSPRAVAVRPDIGSSPTRPHYPLPTTAKGKGGLLPIPMGHIHSPQYRGHSHHYPNNSIGSAPRQQCPPRGVVTPQDGFDRQYQLKRGAQPTQMPSTFYPLPDGLKPARLQRHHNSAARPSGHAEWPGDPYPLPKAAVSRSGPATIKHPHYRFAPDLAFMHLKPSERLQRAVIIDKAAWDAYANGHGAMPDHRDPVLDWPLNLSRALQRRLAAEVADWTQRDHYQGALARPATAPRPLSAADEGYKVADVAMRVRRGGDHEGAWNPLGGSSESYRTRLSARCVEEIDERGGVVERRLPGYPTGGRAPAPDGTQPSGPQLDEGFVRRSDACRLREGELMALYWRSLEAAGRQRQPARGHQHHLSDAKGPSSGWSGNLDEDERNGSWCWIAEELEAREYDMASSFSASSSPTLGPQRHRQGSATATGATGPPSESHCWAYASGGGGSGIGAVTDRRGGDRNELATRGAAAGEGAGAGAGEGRRVLVEGLGRVQVPYASRVDDPAVIRARKQLDLSGGW